MSSDTKEHRFERGEKVRCEIPSSSDEHVMNGVCEKIRFRPQPVPQYLIENSEGERRWISAGWLSPLPAEPESLRAVVYLTESQLSHLEQPTAAALNVKLHRASASPPADSLGKHRIEFTLFPREEEEQIDRLVGEAWEAERRCVYWHTECVIARARAEAADEFLAGMSKWSPAFGEEIARGASPMAAAYGEFIPLREIEDLCVGAWETPPHVDECPTELITKLIDERDEANRRAKSAEVKLEGIYSQRDRLQEELRQRIEHAEKAEACIEAAEAKLAEAERKASEQALRACEAEDYLNEPTVAELDRLLRDMEHEISQGTDGTLSGRSALVRVSDMIAEAKRIVGEGVEDE